MQKSVAIVGGGPAGLVAAKTLLHHGGGAKFKITVFEAAERVGGMWRSLPGETGVKCSPSMRTNLSRFTVAFSDLSWASVDLSEDSRTSTTLPMFPKACQVGRYLDAYAQRFLPGVIQLNTRVAAAELIGESGTWNVTYIDTLTQQESKDTFDYLIVASGFFERPTQSIRRSQDPEASTKIQHSSHFRNISSLTETPGKIVVIGGGISGSEAAATAAFQISSARHSTSTQKPAWADSTVYHIINRPFYALPRYIPQDPYNPAIQGYNPAPHFLPLDLNLYNLGRRGGGSITASNGLMPAEKAKKAHEFIRNVIGGDQRDLGKDELVYKPADTQYPAFTGISDTYAEFVRSGLIVPVRGHVANIAYHDNDDEAADRFNVEILDNGSFNEDKGTRTVMADAVGIIEATGFQTHLEYLADDVKKALDYDSSCSRVPFLLSPGSIFSPNVPSLAFVGFYEGPYWEVMEMQARLVAQRWGECAEVASLDISQTQEVREAIKRRQPNVPQFWMADYVGLVDEFSRLSGVKRNDTLFEDSQKGPVFPARYASTSPETSGEKDEAVSIISEIASLLEASEHKARFVAAATFRALQGHWTLQRKIDSKLSASMSGGTFSGTADFHPRIPTTSTYDAEYLYIEEGTFTMDNGFTFPATRRYVYRYDEAADVITTWFAEDDGFTTGALFNTWDFYAPQELEEPNAMEKGWLAKGHHWCSPDTYKSACEFRFRGAGLDRFGITYEVQGPKKDYSHESWYSR